MIEIFIVRWKNVSASSVNFHCKFLSCWDEKEKYKKKMMIVNKQSIQLIEKSSEKSYFVINLFFYTMMDQSSRCNHTKCNNNLLPDKSKFMTRQYFFFSLLDDSTWKVIARRTSFLSFGKEILLEIKNYSNGLVEERKEILRLHSQVCWR